jgi:ribosomal protein S12 methylthiotransferase
MRTQQRISLKRNRALVGRVLPVLIEGRAVEQRGVETAFQLVGRSYRDAPEVDGLVFVKPGVSDGFNDGVPEGKIVPVRVVEAMEYDLVGELAR